jgi:predicted acyl esterase
VLVVVALLAVACTSGTTDTTPRTTAPGPARPSSSPLSETTEAWWAYERPATFAVVSSDVDVPVRDGTPLSCHLFRPATGGAPAEGRFPGLIVEFTPYELLAPTFAAQSEFFAARGYNALVCTVRGTGSSGGTWTNAMSSQDGRDAYDLVEWLAAQPFSDGRIGQFGESYGGNTSYAAAIEGARHLLAIAPMQPPGDLYDDVVYPGGIKSTEGGTIDNWPPIGSTLSGGRIDAEAEYALNRAHPTYDAYWRDHTNAGRLSSITVPVLTIGGWDDGYFRSGTLANVEALPERTWAIYGQWPHRTPVDLGGCTVCVPDPLPSGVLLAWFDHWVMELPDVPIPEAPTFVSREGPLESPTSEWLELAWTAEVDGPSYALGPDGRLTTEPAPVGTVTFHEPREPTTEGGSVTFSTEPLDADRVLAGHASLSLDATLSAADASFYVELVDVDADGIETIVNDGFLRASHRQPDVAPRPVAPGEAVEYQIPIRAEHHRFMAGHRLRVRVSGGPSNMLVPTAEAVSVTITTGPDSSLRLPASW